MTEETSIWLLCKSFCAGCVGQSEDDDDDDAEEGGETYMGTWILNVSFHFMTGRLLQVKEEEGEDEG